jgi:hypothetical protein
MTDANLRIEKLSRNRLSSKVEVISRRSKDIVSDALSCPVSYEVLSGRPYTIGVHRANGLLAQRLNFDRSRVSRIGVTAMDQVAGS